MAYLTRTRERVWGGPSFLTMVYLVIGVVVAATHNYFVNVHTGQQILSAILAVVLWPLLLLGVGLHVH